MRRAAFKSRRSAYNAELAAAAPLVLARAGGWCEAGLAGCHGVAVHIHHRKLRSQRGGNTLANLLAVCFPCHHKTHLDPERSYRSGLLVESWRDPAGVPVEREAW
ncbi:MAG: HNH endonuclease signature motif containing protein [Acidimicrobiales bacterium]